ncbi:MAG: hypothetical protein WBA33_02095 [Rhodanobacter lindaniclasticus]
MRFAGSLARRRTSRMLCLVAMALVAGSAMAHDASQSGAEPTTMTRDTSIWVNHDYSIEVSETTQVNAATPWEFHRDLVLPGRKLALRDVFLMGAAENGEGVRAEVALLGDGVRITVHPTRRVGKQLFELDYRVLYQAVDDGKLVWPLTSATDRLSLQRASLAVRLPEETPTSQIQAQFQLDGAPVAAGDHRVTGTRVDLAWHDAVAPGQVLGAVLTFPEVAEASTPILPTGPAWMFNGAVWLAVLAAYYLLAKVFFTGGGDGKPVIVEYEPPTGWSAGAVRLLWRGGWDDRCFATGVLGIAAKGGLTLARQTDGTWVATRTGDERAPTLTRDEQRLRSALFTFGPTAKFSEAHADSTGLAELAFRRALENRCAGERPGDPAWLLIPGWLTALTGATLLFFGIDSPFVRLGEIVVPSLVGVLALAMLMDVVPLALLRATRAQVYFVAAIAAIGLLGGGDRLDWLAGTALLAGQVVAGWWLLRQPPRETPLRRKLRGFRWYLGTAEQQEMDARYKPSLHPELQASLLPYAMALDVAVTWNARFAHSLEEAGGQESFIASMNPDHDDAALDLLAFAQAMASRRPK